MAGRKGSQPLQDFPPADRWNKFSIFPSAPRFEAVTGSTRLQGAEEPPLPGVDTDFSLPETLSLSPSDLASHSIRNSSLEPGHSHSSSAGRRDRRDLMQGNSGQTEGLGLGG